MEKGQVVYCTFGVNTSRYHKGEDFIEGVIEEVGRKYITVKIYSSNYKFDKDTLKQVTNYTPDYYIYFDKQTILDNKEKSFITSKLKSIFDSYQSPKLTLDQLRRINSIIDERKED